MCIKCYLSTLVINYVARMCLSRPVVGQVSYLRPGTKAHSSFGARLLLSLRRDLTISFVVVNDNCTVLISRKQDRNLPFMKTENLSGIRCTSFNI